jgi:hypothetical protein
VPSYRTRRIITVSVVLILLGAGSRLIFGGSSQHSGEIATIKAEGAWKQKPEQPGGIDIPHQDVQVYQALDHKDDTKPPVEHLLPPPEVPQPVPMSSVSPTSPPSPTAPPMENLTPPKLEIDNIQTTVVPAPAAAPAPAPIPTPAPSPVPAPVVTATVAAPPSPSSSPIPAPPAAQPVTAPAKLPAKPAPQTIEQVLKNVESAPKTDRVVQLASMQDQVAAQDMAEKLQIRYAEILGSAQLRVVRANVTGKGIYYRIQSPVVSGEQASGICAEIKKMKAGCILVRP